MAVDPNTGQEYSANTIGGQMGIDALAGAGVETPLLFDLLASAPTAAHTTAWNMRRVSNTMMKGPRRGAQSARGLRQTFSPMSVNRLSSAANIEPLGEKGYTPFNFLANMANKGSGAISKRAMREDPGLMARTVGKRLNAFGAPGEGGTHFSPGTLGRINTLGKVYNTSPKQIAKALPNLVDAARTTNPGLMSRLGESQSFFYKSNERVLSAEMVGASMRGTVSQGLSGYMNASRFGSTNLEMAKMLPESAYARGAAMQAEHLASSSMQWVAKGAKYAPTALRALGVVGNILLARDIAVMGGKLVSHAAKTAVDAGNSVKGSIDKPIMGMGYKDNAIAATSRQRGVMAIQNSRLNMRSALGSEAASIHAAWG